MHPFVDPDRTLLIVVGAHLRAEMSDRRIAYGLRDRLLAHVDAWDTPPAVIVCTDLWYLNHDDLRRCPTISIGAPEVNALTAYLADRLDSVLAVDDDERILRAYSRLLGREFRLVTARDGLEAIELLRSGTQVDAIVAEVDLPEVSGPDLLEWLAQNMPRLASRMLFVTGAQDRPPFSTFVRDHAERVLIKPVAPARLREQLERIASLRPDDAADRPSAPLDAP